MDDYLSAQILETLRHLEDGWGHTGTFDDFDTSPSQETSCGLSRYRATHRQQQSKRARGSSNASHERDGNMFRPTIAWESDGNTSCWADAETAGAVLSLLNKEPVRPSQNHTSSHEQNPQRQRLTCAVCFGSLDHQPHPVSPITAYCDHTSAPESHICTPCLQRSIDIQLSSAGPNALFCPLCHAAFSDTEVHRWAARETFECYSIMKTQAALENDTEFIICPRQGCGFGQLHAGGREDPVVICGACGTKTCFVHRDIVWHEGLNCEEYDEIMDFRTEALSDKRREDKGFMRWLREKYCRRRTGSRGGHQIEPAMEDLLSRRILDKVTKPCPRCTVPTERTGGCKYMRCRSMAAGLAVFGLLMV